MRQADSNRAGFGATLRALELEQFVGRDAEIAHFREWVARQGRRPEILNVTGPGGIGKSALLHLFEALAQATGRRVVTLDGQSIVATEQGLADALGADDAASAAVELNSRPTLLTIDAFEELLSLGRFLQDELLGRLEPQVKVVVASRYPLGLAWSRSGTWHRLIRSMALRPLTRDDGRRWLELQGLTDTRAVEQILRVSGGYPLALTLAADLVLQLGIADLPRAPEWRLAVRSLVEQLLDEIDEPALRELLEAASLVRQFDEPMLAELAGRDDVHQAFARLCRLSFVVAGEHGLMLHDEVRRFISEDLRWRAPARSEELRVRALAHYRREIERAPTVDRARLVLDHLYLWENELFHAFYVPGPEALRMWVERDQPPNCEELHAVWRSSPDQEASVQVSPLPVELPLELLDALLESPDAHLRVVRDADGTALAFGVHVDLTKASLELFPAHGPHRPAIVACLEAADVDLSAESSQALWLSRLVVGRRHYEAAAAVLRREGVRLAASNALYVITTADPIYKSSAAAFGAVLVPEAEQGPTPDGNLFEGFYSDLRKVDIRFWMESVMRGMVVPRPLGDEELRGAIQDAFAHWDDDKALGTSPLVPQLEAAGRDSSPQGIRVALREALAQAKAHARSDQEVAYRALELAYVERVGGHDRIAESLYVSRTTFYRLLKRALLGVAHAWRTVTLVG
jgi:hypothetical protein